MVEWNELFDAKVLFGLTEQFNCFVQENLSLYQVIISGWKIFQHSTLTLFNKCSCCLNENTDFLSGSKKISYLYHNYLFCTFKSRLVHFLQTLLSSASTTKFQAITKPVAYRNSPFSEICLKQKNNMKNMARCEQNKRMNKKEHL